MSSASLVNHHFPSPQPLLYPHARIPYPSMEWDPDPDPLEPARAAGRREGRSRDRSRPSPRRKFYDSSINPPITQTQCKFGRSHQVLGRPPPPPAPPRCCGRAPLPGEEGTGRQMLGQRPFSPLLVPTRPVTERPVYPNGPPNVVLMDKCPSMQIHAPSFCAPTSHLPICITRQAPQTCDNAYSRQVLSRVASLSNGRASMTQ